MACHAVKKNLYLIHSDQNVYNCCQFLLQNDWSIMTRYGNIFLKFFTFFQIYLFLEIEFL